MLRCSRCGEVFESYGQYKGHRPGCQRELWSEHQKAKDKGQTVRAARLAREALGVEREYVPMSEETKAALNTPEAKILAKAKREERKQLKQGLRAMRSQLSAQSKIRRRVLT